MDSLNSVINKDNDLGLVFIMGASRSGSSVLETRLVEQIAALGCGEMRWLWRRGVILNERCQCGDRVRACSFWTRVLSGITDQEAMKIDDCREYFDGLRGVIPLLVPLLRTKAWTEKWMLYSSALNSTYRRILDGGQPVVDSSKSPAYLLCLRAALPYGPEIRVINLIRSPLGVAYSYGKRKLRTESNNESLMRRRGLFMALVYWNAVVFVSAAVALAFQQSASLKFESFCAAPESVLKSLFSEAGVLRTDREDCGARALRHSVSGNPDRMLPNFGEAIRLDQSFKKKPWIWRMSGTVLSLPGLLVRSIICRATTVE
jgi:hypothetical protein